MLCYEATKRNSESIRNSSAAKENIPLNELQS